MDQELWTAVDTYFSQLLSPPDPELENALHGSTAAGLPAISVSPNQGKLLYILAKIRGARSILEVGTLGGYSTIWLARALPSDGKLITIELDPKHADVAEDNIARAGLNGIVQLRRGAALEILPQLAAERQGPFDLVFIDADKPNIPEYFSWALKMSRVGSIIIVDNVVREGAVIDSDSADASVQGVRRLTEMMASESRVAGTVIQTLGTKGYDGFAIGLVISDKNGSSVF